mmetsp:Transcript_19164/g.48697  ORF Transcript_19164/g.48697 Transcript_19164/m.48697 type:complete len:234 (-) Transcript_19164:742-1443(-)
MLRAVQLHRVPQLVPGAQVVRVRHQAARRHAAGQARQLSGLAASLVPDPLLGFGHVVGGHAQQQRGAAAQQHPSSPQLQHQRPAGAHAGGHAHHQVQLACLLSRSSIGCAPAATVQQHPALQLQRQVAPTCAQRQQRRWSGGTLHINPCGRVGCGLVRACACAPVHADGAGGGVAQAHAHVHAHVGPRHTRALAAAGDTFQLQFHRPHHLQHIRLHAQQLQRAGARRGQHHRL